MYEKAAKIIKSGRRVAAFTGAGISVESGIPPFRGDGGLWNEYDPDFLEIGHFKRNPKASWELLKKVFYDGFAAATPNAAHRVIAAMEKAHLLETVVTQNIDSLHQKAGSRKVYEFHGTLRRLVCLGCSKEYPLSEVDLGHLPPECRICGGLLKPDVVLFRSNRPIILYLTYSTANTLSRVLDKECRRENLRSHTPLFHEPFAECHSYAVTQSQGQIARRKNQFDAGLSQAAV